MQTHALADENGSWGEGSPRELGWGGGGAAWLTNVTKYAHRAITFGLRKVPLGVGLISASP